MKKLIILTTLSMLLYSCKKEEKSGNSNEKRNPKNVSELQAKKAQLQAEIAKIDETLSKLDVKKEDALVSVLQIKDTIFNHYLEVQGNVDTQQNVLIQPEMPGTLVTLNVKAGQRVGKGQVLGRTDDGGMSQSLASAENQYSLARTTFERQKNLWTQKIGSEMQYLQAQAQMVSAQKSVAQIKAQLSKTIIHAPFSGVIDEVYVERGQVVAPNPQGLMRIVNLGNMFVSTSIPETYIGKVKPGTEVEVFLASLGKTYKGRVRQVGNFINPNNRSFGIQVSVPNPDGLLRPNQVAKLKIIDYTNANAVIVPSNVVQKDAENNEYLYVVNDVNGNTGIAKKVLVKTGQTSNNATEIISGLSAEDVIIIDGVNTVSDGMKVNF